MEALSGRTFEFHQCNLFDLEALDLGAFDLTLCLGVLYHLPDPVRGLYVLSKIPAKAFILETLVSRDHGDKIVAEYIPADSVNGDYTNFWAPTPKCCEAILSDVGFDLESVFLNDDRAMFRCTADQSKLPSKKMRVAYTAMEH